ncbi:MAG: HypC/HybG/HupF family hydrogenase formation chaperone [Chloroflexi bacterium]|nr:HypC/HybG/HupF family hydrogenase formation chaperone [Chloroflexota bacterium]
MCLVLPARVLSVEGDRAEIEQHGGQHATVGCALRPDIEPGDFVLVDRGLIIERIDAAEAAAILEMYAEIGNFLDAVDGPVA